MDLNLIKCAKWHGHFSIIALFLVQIIHIQSTTISNHKTNILGTTKLEMILVIVDYSDSIALCKFAKSEYILQEIAINFCKWMDCSDLKREDKKIQAKN